MRLSSAERTVSSDTRRIVGNQLKNGADNTKRVGSTTIAHVSHGAQSFAVPWDAAKAAPACAKGHFYAHDDLVSYLRRRLPHASKRCPECVHEYVASLPKVDLHQVFGGYQSVGARADGENFKHTGGAYQMKLTDKADKLRRAADTTEWRTLLENLQTKIRNLGENAYGQDIARFYNDEAFPYFVLLSTAPKGVNKTKKLSNDDNHADMKRKVLSSLALYVFWELNKLDEASGGVGADPPAAGPSGQTPPARPPLQKKPTPAAPGLQPGGRVAVSSEQVELAQRWIGTIAEPDDYEGTVDGGIEASRLSKYNSFRQFVQPGGDLANFFAEDERAVIVELSDRKKLVADKAPFIEEFTPRLDRFIVERLLWVVQQYNEEVYDGVRRELLLESNVLFLRSGGNPQARGPGDVILQRGGGGGGGGDTDPEDSDDEEESTDSEREEDPTESSDEEEEEEEEDYGPPDEDTPINISVTPEIQTLAVEWRKRFQAGYPDWSSTKYDTLYNQPRTRYGDDYRAVIAADFNLLADVFNLRPVFGPDNRVPSTAELRDAAAKFDAYFALFEGDGDAKNESTIDRLQEELAQLRLENAQLKEGFEAEQRPPIDAQNRIRDLERELAEVRATNTQGAGTVAGLNVRIKELERVLQDKDDEIALLNADIDQKNITANDLSQALIEKENEIKDLQAELEEAQATDDEETESSDEEDPTESSDEEEDDEEVIAGLQAQIDDLTNEVNDKDEQIASLEADKLALEARVAAAAPGGDQVVPDIVADLEAQITELEEAQEKSVQELNEQLDEKDQQIDELNAENQTLDNDIFDLKQEVENLQDQLGEAQRTSEDLRQDVVSKQNEINRIRAQRAARGGAGSNTLDLDIGRSRVLADGTLVPGNKDDPTPELFLWTGPTYNDMGTAALADDNVASLNFDAKVINDVGQIVEIEPEYELDPLQTLENRAQNRVNYFAPGDDKVTINPGPLNVSFDIAYFDVEENQQMTLTQTYALMYDVKQPGIDEFSAMATSEKFKDTRFTIAIRNFAGQISVAYIDIDMPAETRLKIV